MPPAEPVLMVGFARRSRRNDLSLSLIAPAGPNQLTLLFVARRTFSHCESRTSLVTRTTLTQCYADPGRFRL